MFSAVLLNRHFAGRALFRGIFFLPVEAAGIMASIAGIGELAKEAQARGIAAEASRPRGSVPSTG